MAGYYLSEFTPVMFGAEEISGLQAGREYFNAVDSADQRIRNYAGYDEVLGAEVVENLLVPRDHGTSDDDGRPVILHRSVTGTDLTYRIEFTGMLGAIRKSFLRAPGLIACKFADVVEGDRVRLLTSDNFAYDTLPVARNIIVSRSDLGAER